MAYEKKNGDIVFFKNDKVQDGEPRASGNIYLDGESYPVKVFKNENAEGRQPNFRAEIDKNGTRLNAALWLDEEPEGARPNFTGRLDYQDGYEYRVALWEREAKESKKIFWSGQVDFSPEFRKEKKTMKDSTPSAPSTSAESEIDESLPF